MLSPTQRAAKRKDLAGPAAEAGAADPGAAAEGRHPGARAARSDPDQGQQRDRRRARRGELRDDLRRERAQQRDRHRRQIAGSDPARSSSSSRRAASSRDPAGLTAQAVADLVGGRLLGDGAVVVELGRGRSTVPGPRRSRFAVSPRYAAELRASTRGPCWSPRPRRGRRGPPRPGGGARSLRGAGARHRPSCFRPSRTAARHRSHRAHRARNHARRRRDHRAVGGAGRGVDARRPMPAGPGVVLGDGVVVGEDTVLGAGVGLLRRHPHRPAGGGQGRGGDRRRRVRLSFRRRGAQRIPHVGGCIIE